MDSEPSFKSMMKSARTNGTGISNEAFQKNRQCSPGGPSKSQASNDWPEGSTYMNYPEGTPLPKSGPKVNTNLVNVPGVGENVGYATLAPKNDLTHGDVIDAVRHPSKKEDSEEEAPEKTTPEKKSASDPLLEAIHQMRYGESFQKGTNAMYRDQTISGTDGAADAAMQREGGNPWETMMATGEAARSALGNKSGQYAPSTLTEKEADANPDAAEDEAYAAARADEGRMKPNVNEARARMADTDGEGEGNPTFDAAASDDEQYWINRGMDEVAAEDPGYFEGEGEYEGVTSPKRASASDPVLNAISMMRYGHAFQKADVDELTPMTDKDKVEDEQNPETTGVSGGIEHVNPNPVHSD